MAYPRQNAIPKQEWEHRAEVLSTLVQAGLYRKVLVVVSFESQIERIMDTIVQFTHPSLLLQVWASYRVSYHRLTHSNEAQIDFCALTRLSRMQGGVFDMIVPILVDGDMTADYSLVLPSLRDGICPLLLVKH